MMIAIHVLLGFAILITGSDFAAMDGRLARKLALPGAGIIPFIPWMALGVYALVVILTRRKTKRWVRIGGVLAGYLLASTVIQYPNWIFKRSSEKIAIQEFMPLPVIKDFEYTFSTATVVFSSSSSGGPWLVIPRRNYTDSMRLWINDKEKELAEQSSGRDSRMAAPQKLRSGRNDDAIKPDR